MPATDELSVSEAAERLGVHYMTAYSYVRTGRLDARREGAQWRIRRRAVDQLLEPLPRRHPKSRARTPGATRRASDRERRTRRVDTHRTRADLGARARRRPPRRDQSGAAVDRPAVAAGSPRHQRRALRDHGRAAAHRPARAPLHGTGAHVGHDRARVRRRRAPRDGERAARRSPAEPTLHGGRPRAATRRPPRSSPRPGARTDRGPCSSERSGKRGTVEVGNHAHGAARRRPRGAVVGRRCRDRGPRGGARPRRRRVGPATTAALRWLRSRPPRAGADDRAARDDAGRRSASGC